MPQREYGNDKEDKFFFWKGMKPPERTPHMTTEERDQMLADNLKDHSCVWKQKGNEIFCEEGNLVHGRRIGTDKRLGGQKDGQPLLVPVGPVLRDSVKHG